MCLNNLNNTWWFFHRTHNIRTLKFLTSMLTNEQLSNLKEILNTNAPSGYEQQAINWMQKQVSPYCRTETDSIGNLYMYAGCKNENSLKVMITAHADEVGFQITDIDGHGYAYVRKVSGLDSQTIPGTAVVAITNNGEIKGVFGKKSPHILNGKERDKVPEVEDLWIDFGFESKEEALEFLNYGDYVTAQSHTFITQNGKKIVSKALDNKISLFILAEVMKQVSQQEPPIQVVGVATTQEELGCRGCKIAANKVNPDIAFCLDVGIATDIPKLNSQKYGNFKLGNGVGVIRNADNNEKLTQTLINTAKANNIQYQHIVGHQPTGGTESSVVQLSLSGIPTANLSIPNRYMHSIVEMCDLRDVENAIDLLVREVDVLKECIKEDFYLYKQ